MDNNKYLIGELRRELILAYRRDFRDITEEINWTDALCGKFANLITGVVESLSEDGVVKTLDHMVSESTVQRILTRKLILKDTIHAKTRHVLNNICLYLGYWSWADFEYKKEREIGIFNRNEKLSRSGENLSDHEKERVRFYLNIVEEAKTAEIETYKKIWMKEFDGIDMLKEYFSENGLEYARIRNVCKRMSLAVFEIKGFQSRFTLEGAVMTEESGTPILYVKVFSHQEWVDRVNPLNNTYFSLYTFQEVAFTSDNKISQIRYIPTCQRDVNYVESVYGIRAELTPAEQSKPAPYMYD